MDLMVRRLLRACLPGGGVRLPRFGAPSPPQGPPVRPFGEATSGPRAGAPEQEYFGSNYGSNYGSKSSVKPGEAGGPVLEAADGGGR